MIKLKKAIELLDAVTSVPYSRKGLGYTNTIGRGLDAILPFTCFSYMSYWFSCYFDQRGKLMKALPTMCIFGEFLCRKKLILGAYYHDYRCGIRCSFFYFVDMILQG
jgi:hypothetical protein